jgi:hypothetical protein
VRAVVSLICFAKGESGSGTTRTCRLVTSAIAIRGKADIQRALLGEQVPQVRALATSLSANSLPQSGLVQYMFCDTDFFRHAHRLVPAGMTSV